MIAQELYILLFAKRSSIPPPLQMPQIIPPHPLPRHHGRIPRNIPHRPRTTHLPRSTHLRSPSALQSPHPDLNQHPLIQPRRSNKHGIQRPRWKKSSRSAPDPTVEKHLDDTPIQHDLHPARPGIRIHEVRDREFVREERVLETAHVAPVQEEGGVAAQVQPAADALARDGGQEGEVRGTRRVRGGDVADVDAEVDGAAGDAGAVVVQHGGVRGGRVREAVGRGVQA